MKKALLLIQLSIFLVTACKEESSHDDISKLSTERREVLIESKGNTAYYDFQKNTSCITPLITDADPFSLEKNRILVKNLGFSVHFGYFLSKPDWIKLEPKYQNIVSSPINEKERNMLRQVGSFQILVNQALLAETNQSDKIKFYTNEYVDAGGECSSLLYYCIKTLGQTIDDTQIQKWIRIINKRHDDFVKSEMQIAGLKPSDLTDTELLNEQDIHNSKANEARLINREITFNGKLKEFIPN